MTEVGFLKTEYKNHSIKKLCSENYDQVFFKKYLNTKTVFTF